MRARRKNWSDTFNVSMGRTCTKQLQQQHATCRHLARKSTSRGGRPTLLHEGQLENCKIEVGKRSMEGRGYTLKSGEFAHDLRKYARATLKDAGDQHYNTKQLVMSERVVSA